MLAPFHHEDWNVHRRRRVRISRTDQPELVRVFELPLYAPESWLPRAFDIATGQPSRFREICTATESEWGTAVAGEPYVQLIEPVGDTVGSGVSGAETPGEGSPGSVAPHWSEGAAPFRASHVQDELNLAFGFVPLEVSIAGIITRQPSLHLHSPIVRLLERLAPERRLALRVHLEDRELLRPPTLDLDDALSLTAGLRCALALLGEQGVAQGPDGWVSEHAVEQVERQLTWPSSGDALWDLVKRLRLARRLRGRVVSTTHGRSVVTNPKRFVAKLAHELLLQSASEHSSVATTLALLAIADGTASDLAALPSTILRGVAPPDEGNDDAEEWSDDYSQWISQEEASSLHLDADLWRRAPAAATAVSHLWSPLSAPGAIGALTPEMRTLAHLALF